MMPFLGDTYANASSTHKFGLTAHNAVNDARKVICNLIGCETHELFFTSGSTEAINLILKGLWASNPERKEIITLRTEHSAVLDTCNALELAGAKITFVPVDREGLIDLDFLANAVTSATLLVSVMYVNNETGVIQPLQQVSEIAHKAGAFFMSDATQAVGKIPCKVDELGIDLMCISGHKFYGPKGIGGVFVRQRRPFRAKLLPLIHGGGHERGMRSGTLNVPGIIGLGKAAELAHSEMTKDQKRILPLRDFLESELLKIEGTAINGSATNRIYSTSNICFTGIDSDALIMGLEDIAVSNGSACTANSIEPSHVLLAMGQSEDQAFSAIRFSLGRFNNSDEVGQILQAVKSEVTRIRVLTDQSNY